MAKVKKKNGNGKFHLIGKDDAGVVAYRGEFRTKAQAEKKKGSERAKFIRKGQRLHWSISKDLSEAVNKEFPKFNPPTYIGKMAGLGEKETNEIVDGIDASLEKIMKEFNVIEMIQTKRKEELTKGEKIKEQIKQLVESFGEEKKKARRG